MLGMSGRRISLFLATAALFGCNRGIFSGDRLVGTWKSTLSLRTYLIDGTDVYKPDGTLTSHRLLHPLREQSGSTVDFSGTWTPAGKNAYLRQIKDINYSFAGVTAEEAEAIRQQLEAQKAQALSNANVAPEMDVRWAGPDAFLVIERGLQNAYRRAQ